MSIDAGSMLAAGAIASASAAAAAAAPPKLERAYLQLYEPSLDGGLDKPGPELGRIEFQFNPKELTLGKTANWAPRQPVKGTRASGPPQYNGPQPQKLTLEMFFDASDTRDDSVVKRVQQLLTCCVPTASSHQQKKGSPPWVVFRWGPLTEFLSYVKSVQAKYSLFTSTGLPIRATCTVALEELAGEPPRQNPTSGGLLPRRVHVVVEGDNLAGVAYREYGDASMWRAVATVNDIDDPMRLRPGSAILLPTAEELNRPPVDEQRARKAAVERAARLDGTLLVGAATATAAGR